jgi:glycerol-3-phosphate dehydrogenase (NAD(P)+)
MRIGILGSGSWATALVKMLTDNGNQVNWWIRNSETIQYIQKRRHNPHYLSAVYFDVALLSLNENILSVIDQSDVLVVAVPSAYVETALLDIPTNALQGKKIISAVKGILPDGNLLLNQFLFKRFAVLPENYFTILGPCHAEEVAAEKLSYLSFSGIHADTVASLATYFKTDYVNTIVNTDIWGVQYAAVLKNIYALGAGIAHGLEYGDNFLSVYIANCGNEMVHFLKKVKAGQSTTDETTINYAASVYLGDLLVTCYSLYSRNRTFGNMIGKGYSVKSAQLELNMVAEGYNAAKCIHEINREVLGEMPIANTIYRILWKQVPAITGFREIENFLV